MKLKDIKILSGLTMGLMLATTSCRDDTFSNYWDDSDEFTVTLNVNLEDMNNATRADGEYTPAIGSGSQIDMLVYAVYYDRNKANDIISDTPDWWAATEYVKDYEEGETPFEGNFSAGYGQSVVDVSEYLAQGKPYPITLTLKKGQNYQVVFWAQNHETQAFVIDDLKRVQMKYKLMDEDSKEDGSEDPDETLQTLNNDEKRDAFCRSISLNGNQTNKNITVYLKRPLAQINVGTVGYDFETITRNAEKKYLYSKIRINRAARFYNVVEDYTYTTTTVEPTDDNPNPSPAEAFYTVDYEYNKLPAYWKMDIPNNEKNIPTFPSYTIYDAEQFSQIYHHSGEDGITDKESFIKVYQNEEFLKVKLPQYADVEGYREDGYLPYAGMGVSGGDEDAQTEIFKYLSMCYILTPTDDSKSDVLYNVKMWMATDEDGSDEVEVVNLNNVPVQRNHRTNIVGKLLTAKADLQIIVDEAFAGRKVKGDEDVVSGEIAEGFYYDADANEFQISSVNGLLFFQQLVNGELTIRQKYNNTSDKDYNKAKVDDPYPYYASNGSTTYFLKSKSHPKSEFKDQTIADIIVKGSGYDKLVGNNFTDEASGKTWTITVEQENGWPKYNNFPFYGATVKLMADIDLSGIEWIPIGFDCANYDGSVGNSNEDYTEGYTDKLNGNTIINYTSLNSSANEISLGKRRAFCGTFDGNGHTIYNLTTKKFSPKVHGAALQEPSPKKADGKTNDTKGPFDNVQWFARGFFGVVGPNAVIKDLRLQNVDISGNNAVGAIVGQVSSVGFPAKIQNCIVDGGTINVEPLYRGDGGSNFYVRSIARGCYIGGIVGQFVAKDDLNSESNKGEAEVSGCEVRNVTMRGFRRMGSIIGGIADQGPSQYGSADIQIAIKVEGNSVSNTLMFIDQFVPFNVFWDHMGTDSNSGTWMNGFGWGTGNTYVPMTDNFVGGYFTNAKEEATVSSGNISDSFSGGTNYIKKLGETTYGDKTSYFVNYVNAKNNLNNLRINTIAATPNDENAEGLTSDKVRHATERITTIDNVPLKYIPVLSSLYTDKITLNSNYYGETEIKTKIEFYNCDVWKNTSGQTAFWLPLNFPNSWDTSYDNVSTYAGMYVESVELDGAGNTMGGGRSVITPSGVDGDHSCVMYVTARDREQYKVDKYSGLAKDTDIDDDYIQPTTIQNVVLRGSPYAWAGIILAPNKNMEGVTLKNVAIYDVYKTITLERKPDEVTPKVTDKEQIYQNYTYWPWDETPGSSQEVKLNLIDCNLRGYTDPGEGWSQITYTGTTFESGSQTKYSYDDMKDSTGAPHENRNEYKTCKVEAKTDFINCYFKAPYYIDLDHEKADVTFTGCWGSSAYDNVAINLGDAEKKAGQKILFIAIEKSTQAGKTLVLYYYGRGENDYVSL